MTDFKVWIKAAGIRALKTVAQTAVSTIGISATMGEVNWDFGSIFIRACGGAVTAHIDSRTP